MAEGRATFDRNLLDRIARQVVTLERIEHVRIGRKISITHLKKRQQCSDCLAYWVPNKTRTACPRCSCTAFAKAPLEDPVLEDEVLPLLMAAEQKAAAEVIKAVRTHPVWYNWAAHVPGIGEKTVGYILGKCDFEKMQFTTNMWAHCGIGLKDGVIQRRTKGKPIDYDANLRSRVTIAGESFMKAADFQYRVEWAELDDDDKPGKVEHKGFYRTNQDEMEELLRTLRGDDRMVDVRVLEQARSTQLCYHEIFVNERRRAAEVLESSGHIHNRGFRHMLKIFASHFHMVARRELGLPVHMPYAFAILKHGPRDYIDPDQMMRTERTKRAA
jgi:hypothetical protein